jgi:hypothetical protein
MVVSMFLDVFHVAAFTEWERVVRYKSSSQQLRRSVPLLDSSSSSRYHGVQSEEAVVVAGIMGCSQRKQ